MPSDIEITWKHPKVSGEKAKHKMIYLMIPVMSGTEHTPVCKEGKERLFAEVTVVSSDAGKGLGGWVLVAEIPCSFLCVSVRLGSVVMNSSWALGQ